MSSEEQTTGVPDAHFDLISVIYHTLQATTLYDTYIRDAEEAGDEEVAQFLRETQDAAKTTGQKAHALLAARIKQ
jgi:arginine utilization protein RocB